VVYSVLKQHIRFFLRIAAIALTCMQVSHAAPDSFSQLMDQAGTATPDLSPEALEKSHHVPNELNSYQAAPVLQAAPTGVQISVGSERGFINFGYNLNATHLLLVDSDPNVVFYNQMNIALMNLSRNRLEFIHLKYRARPEEVATLARERLNDLNPQTARLLTHDAQMKAFRSLTQSSPRWASIHSLVLGQGVNLDHPTFSFEHNYMVHDPSFAKVKSRADLGRVQAIQGNLHDVALATRTARVISDSGLQLSALDPSNSWHSPYSTPAQAASFIDALRPCARPESVVMFTGMLSGDGANTGSSRDRDLRMRQGDIEFQWGYAGRTYGSLTNREAWRRFLTYANSDSANWVFMSPRVSQTLDGKKLTPVAHPPQPLYGFGFMGGLELKHDLPTSAALSAVNCLLEELELPLVPHQ
jgi:hypothetical protein